MTFFIVLVCVVVYIIKELYKTKPPEYSGKATSMPYVEDDKEEDLCNFSLLTWDIYRRRNE